MKSIVEKVFTNNMPAMHQSEPVSDSKPELRQSSDNRLRKLKNKKVAGGIVVLAIIVALFYFKGLLVAASVNGKLISRWSVIHQLEKQSGKSVLNSLIEEKLIELEAKNKKIVISDDEINQEIKKIDTMITQQGGTLQAALAQKGLTEKNLRDQIRTQKEVEKLLADKIQVTDADISKYISDNKIPVPKGKEVDIRAQVANQLHSQKLNQEAVAWLNTLRTQASIIYYVNY